VKKPFYKLRWELKENDFRQDDVAYCLGCSTIHVGQCLRGQAPFRGHEMYRILDLLHVDHGEMSEYFPAEDCALAEKKTAIKNRRVA